MEDYEGKGSEPRPIPDDCVICTCSLCNGSYVPLRTRRQHTRIFAIDDRPHPISTTTTLDKKIILKTPAAQTAATAPDTNQDSANPEALDDDVFKMTLMTESLQESAEEICGSSQPMTQSDQVVFDKIWEIDDQHRIFAGCVTKSVQDMDRAFKACDEVAVCKIRPLLQGYSHSLQNQLEELISIDTLGDEAHEVWKAALRKSMEDLLGVLRDTGYTDISEVLRLTDPEMNTINTDEHLGAHIHSIHPFILIPILLVLSLNLFAHLSREWCNSSLRALRLYAKLAVSEVRKSTAVPLRMAGQQLYNPTDLDFLLQNFPLDLRTVKNRFGMQAKVEVYAVCPNTKCCAVYAPIIENGVKTYPRTCTKIHLYRRVENTCGALLCVDGVVEKKSTRVPIKSFPVQNWDDFKARLLVNPLILTLLRRGVACAAKHEKRDIKDGTHLAGLLGPDGKTFMDPDCSELRLAWSFSTDWFNPFHNYAAGKSASVGSMAMTCLNLPPSFRYKPECVFLAGLIPGPEEPKDDLVNNFLDVVVDQLESSYEHGTYYSTTYIFPKGIVERSIVATFVFDLPGARKCCGMKSHSSKRNFCHLCLLHLSEINNLDSETWPMRNFESHITDALAWREELGKTKRDNIFARTGVRWTPFLRLQYFHPHHSIIIDGMHNLFLGLCMYHVRNFLGIDARAEEELLKSEAKVNLEELAAARSKLKAEPNIGTIKSFSFSILRALCDENDVFADLDDLDEKPRPQKKAFQRALLSRILEKKPRSVDPTGFVDDLIGDDFFGQPDPSRTIGQITDAELKRIHECIASTQRPRSHRGPPRNLGEARHGKLKADQWRSLMEFDIPVALSQLWDETSERQQLFHCTMLLAIAVRYATSHIITEKHIANYKKYMHEYLRALLEIDPQIKLRPNHHEALHIPVFLDLFGPMHGWWMFVYERMIGLLQNSNSNHKIGGQMERTIMDSFCAASNFRGFLKRPDLPREIREIASTIELPVEIRDMLELQSSDHDFGKKACLKVSKEERGKARLQNLDDDVIKALQDSSDYISALVGQSWSPPQQAVKVDRMVFEGNTFSVEKTTKSMGLICTKSGGSYTPAKLREILSITYPDVSNENFLLRDPFHKYPEFGASLWSKKCYDRPSIAPVVPGMKFCHGICRKWDERHIVVKAVDREIQV